MSSITTALVGFLFLSGPQSWASAENRPVPVHVDPPASYVIILTGYNAVPEQTDSDPFTTASGAYSNPEVVAARSVDLRDQLPFGTVIKFEYNASTTPDCGFNNVRSHVGYRVIADDMNDRMRNKVDILFGEDEDVNAGGIVRNAASALGFCRGVKITVVGKVDIAKIPQTQAQLVRIIEHAPPAIAKR